MVHSLLAAFAVALCFPPVYAVADHAETPSVVVLESYMDRQFGPEWRVFPTAGLPTTCPACGYDLRGAIGPGICPECGMAYADTSEPPSPPIPPMAPA